MITINPYRRLESDSGLPLIDNADILKPEQILVLAPLENTGSKHDATGAFHPGAHYFRKVHSLGPENEYKFDNKLGRYAMCERVIQEVEDRGSLVVVGFHHGYQHAVQWGLRSPGHPRATTRDLGSWERFHDAIRANAPSGFTCPVLVWFACTTGRDPDGAPDTAPGSGDGSFADLSRDALCLRWLTQCSVVAHTTAGHSWWNRDLKRFDGNGVQNGGVGAELIAIDGSDADSTATLERQKLSDLLRTDWAYTFAFKPLKKIREELTMP